MHNFKKIQIPLVLHNYGALKVLHDTKSKLFEKGSDYILEAESDKLLCEFRNMRIYKTLL